MQTNYFVCHDVSKILCECTKAVVIATQQEHQNIYLVGEDSVRILEAKNSSLLSFYKSSSSNTIYVKANKTFTQIEVVPFLGNMPFPIMKSLSEFTNLVEITPTPMLRAEGNYKRESLTGNPITINLPTYNAGIYATKFLDMNLAIRSSNGTTRNMKVALAQIVSNGVVSGSMEVMCDFDTSSNVIKITYDAPSSTITVNGSGTLTCAYQYTII